MHGVTSDCWDALLEHFSEGDLQNPATKTCH